MRKWLLFILFASTLLTPAGAGAQSLPGPWTQVGGLSCKLAPTIGLIVLSEQKMACEFKPNQPGWPVQRYAGTMTNVGIDLGATAGGVLGWAVFASTVGPAFGGLGGTYVGASGEITVGVGGGANVLIGGSGRSVALQPLSLQGTAGLNVQLGVASLELITNIVRLHSASNTRGVRHDNQPNTSFSCSASQHACMRSSPRL